MIMNCIFNRVHAQVHIKIKIQMQKTLMTFPKRGEADRKAR